MTTPASEQDKDTKAGDTAPDPSKFVPKGEVDKLSQTVQSLQADLEKAKLELLSPEYVNFLTEKKGAKQPPKSTPSANPEVEELRGVVKALNDKLGMVSAFIELQQVEGKYEDFNEYRPDVQKILENDDISIEDAYIKAKFLRAQKGDDKAKGEDNPPPKKKSSGERPGSGFTPPQEPTPSFKSREEADKHVIESVKSKYGLQGDTI